MKKLLCAILSLVLLVPMMAVAEGEDWMELNETGDVLTIRLADDAADTGAWTAKISDETRLQMLSNAPADGLWTATFGAVSGAMGDVRLSLMYEGGEAEDREIELFVNEDGTLLVNAWRTLPPADAWYSLFDPAVLSVRLPLEYGSDCRWTCEVSDEAVLELLSANEIPAQPAEPIGKLDGEFAASVRGLKSGYAQLTLNYGTTDAAVSQRVMELHVDDAMMLQLLSIAEYVNEDGLMTLDSVVTFPEPAVTWFALDVPTVLTVTLPLADADENTWAWEISDESLLELVTMETLADDDGTGEFVASFRGLAAGSVILKLVDTETGENAVDDSKIMELTINENLEIVVANVMQTK